ncbi:hypothetical protein ENSA5_14950 [Enhygromyxa salina]|uniref:Gram-negative bacterial tonB protein n=1 Tax=Enhygromyxa salina TaxID=215803 RepID=A0A2S9YEE0_9BACT|nr:TonB family protein [Enhygromyxa salina]PRQ03465.1 hypothetical protein ENSA5_14950 [Enhygromyxa salina]
MNFEHYLDHNRPNPKRAALLTLAAALSISGTTMMLAAGWVAGKMSIARVDPPSTEYILLSMTADQPTPPPPPPPPPAGASEEPEEPEPDDEVPEDPEPLEEVQPDKPTKIPDPKAGGAVGGVPKGVPGGQFGGVIGGIPGGGIGERNPLAISVKPAAKDTITKKPLAAVMARAVYSPDPDRKLLQQTKAARFDKRDGKATVSFCIDANGKVVNVKTKSKFPGDPQVDKILRTTIASWRFKASEVGSKKMKTCTERTFSLKFQ